MIQGALTEYHHIHLYLFMAPVFLGCVGIAHSRVVVAHRQHLQFSGWQNSICYKGWSPVPLEGRETTVIVVMVTLALTCSNMLGS